MGAIGDYLATYVNKGTRQLIYSSIKHFLISIYDGNLKRLDEEWETLAHQYFSECRAGKRDFFKDLLNYVTYLAKKERPPASVYGYVNSAKNWITYTLDVDLSPKQRKILRCRLPKGKRARTNEDDLTRERLKKILTHCDTKGRALFLFLASSGIRIGEALQLRMSDIDLDHDPPKVTVRGEYAKEGDKYITFISKEAKTALEEWLKIREEYLRQAFQKGRGLGRQRLKPEEDDRIFPFSDTVAHEMWTNALRKAGLEDWDKNTKRRTMRIHMLRKWFMSQMKIAVPETVVEAFAGHTGYLDEAYRRYTCKQLAELYKRGESHLYIFIPKEVEEIQTEFRRDFEKMQRKIEDLYQKLTDANVLTIKLMEEKDELREKVAELTRENEELKRRLVELKAEVKMMIRDEIRAQIKKLKEQSSQQSTLD